MKRKMFVYLLEAKTSYEGSTLVGIYADKAMAEKEKKRLDKLQARWLKALMEDKPLPKDAGHQGSDIEVSAPVPIIFAQQLFKKN